MNIVVGCPVKDRNWIMPTWKRYVEEAMPDGVDFHFLFVVGNKDTETLELLESWDKTTITKVDEENDPYLRSWKPDRLRHMVFLRNSLLEGVRKLGPDYFLSLDSDILIHPDTISNFIETMTLDDDLDNHAAVGGLAFMDQVDKRVTSFGMFNSHGFRRIASKGPHDVDVIMAIKMMNLSGYNVDYEFDRNGEDIGWCRAIRKKGLRLFCDGRSANKHVMEPYWLDTVDGRIGW